MTKRVALERVPEVNGAYRHEGSPWESKWVAHPGARVGETSVVGYRVRAGVEKPAVVRVHVSADQRYELFVDGERVGRGPERGDRQNWFFESYDLDLGVGEHVIVARVAYLAASTPSAYAQVSVRPGFWLEAEGEWGKKLSTGVAPWEAKVLGGYSFHLDRQPAFMAIGGQTRIEGGKYDWGFERGDGGHGEQARRLHGEGWEKVVVVGNACPGWLLGEWGDAWLLRPGTLPAMVEREVRVGVVRWVGGEGAGETGASQRDAAKSGGATGTKVGEVVVREETNLKGEVGGWNELLAGKGTVEVPAKTVRRVVVDLQNYYCAYPQVVVSGGRGAVVRVRWAEALYVPGGHQWEKGNRDEVEGKVFRGVGDVYTLEGGDRRRYEPLWWEAGRYVEISVETGDEPVRIEGFVLRETHYPHKFEQRFEASDGRMAGIVPLAERVLEMCSHETYMDCPYYEQLMYEGDTRLEVLVTYATTRDDRLPRKALGMFDASRDVSWGLTQARYPSRVRQYIGPFSLWFVGMVHDYAMWRDDVGFVRERMPGVRAVLDAYRRYGIDEHGLLGAMPGWNFADWVTGWGSGVPPTGERGPVATHNFQLAWVLRQAAELEELVGEPEMAARNLRTADLVTRPANEAFWDESRGVYAEDLGHKHFSQHAQCLALLGSSVPAERVGRMVDGLFGQADLAPTTIYFTHYLFEACRVTGRMDAFFKRLEPWYELKRLGFKTTVEMPEPARSDCHAWGAHPLFHYHATVLGVRPGCAGFRTVRVEPQLGALEWARGVMTHPKGLIKAEWKRAGKRMRGTIELPEGVAGQAVMGGEVVELNCGVNKV